MLSLPAILALAGDCGAGNSVRLYVLDDIVDVLPLQHESSFVLMGHALILRLLLVALIAEVARCHIYTVVETAHVQVFDSEALQAVEIVFHEGLLNDVAVLVTSDDATARLSGLRLSFLGFLGPLV